MADKFIKPKGDYSTILGIMVALCLVGFEMGKKILTYFNFPSAMIVVGGTISVIVACYSWREMGGLLKSIKATVLTKVNDPKQISEHLIEVAEHARKKGLLSLQQKESSIIRGSIMQKGVMMLVDGHKIEDIEPVLKQDIESTVLRNKRSAAMLRKAAEIAPAMGLIGTLIGLVQMLSELDNPSNIGPNMALALLTTLYGALLAFMVFTPLASKIERNSDEELLLDKIYLHAIISISIQENPRMLERKINTILPPSKRIRVYKDDE